MCHGSTRKGKGQCLPGRLLGWPIRFDPGRQRIIAKGLSGNNCCVQALRFGLDLADLIEQNRSNSSAISRILRLRVGQRRPEDEMHQCNSYSLTGPNGRGDFRDLKSPLTPMPETGSTNHKKIAIFPDSRDFPVPVSQQKRRGWKTPAIGRKCIFI